MRQRDPQRNGIGLAHPLRIGRWQVLQMGNDGFSLEGINPRLQLDICFLLGRLHRGLASLHWTDVTLLLRMPRLRRSEPADNRRNSGVTSTKSLAPPESPPIRRQRTSPRCDASRRSCERDRLGGPAPARMESLLWPVGELPGTGDSAARPFRSSQSCSSPQQAMDPLVNLPLL